MKVKGISQLRLNQDTMEIRVKGLGAGGLAQSAGNSWGSAQSSERCVLVRISVGESGTVTGRADGPGAGRFDQMGLRLGIGSGQAPRVMDLRQKDKEKAKEKEKEVAPGDRTPKVRGKDSLILRPWPDQIPMKDQKWTVVREKHHEDRGHGKMCGDWVDSENCGTRRYKSRKGKEATGASGAVGQDGAEQTGVLPAGTIPTTVLPALVEQVDKATGLPVGPTLPTEVNETNVDEQQEQVHGEDTGSSNVGAGSGQNVDANNVRVTGAEEVIEPTIRGLVEAMQVMGAQIASLTQAFTPLVNSSVGQANPPVRVAAGVTDVKGISQLRLNQDTMEIRVKGLGAGGLAQSAGNSWGQLNPVNGAFWFGSVWASPGRLLGEPMVRVQDGRKGEKPPRGGYGTVMERFWEEKEGILVTVRPGERNTEKIQERKRDRNFGSADLIQEIVLECSWCVWACDQEDGFETERQGEGKGERVAPGDRTPKVRGKDSLILRPLPDQIPMKDQKWTVVREKHHEDRGHGKMCGDWVDSENCVIIVAYCAACELMRF
ncbi:hypothetical protein IGI04_019414 [Brassica rapa subsp. trilocularis]|uniref:Uncharacterized protein n=1 Tax=Brassica rapa subsp. trilocularis TaxID=1813537 RepID=A0ABQ7MI55_BRACM|nr:hypothetical protein IGI04_019414 [Brassica rapa subsp. trilocularis]